MFGERFKSHIVHSEVSLINECSGTVSNKIKLNQRTFGTYHVPLTEQRVSVIFVGILVVL